ncbi:C2 domain [Trinorchestia longiramus]|nr:C2 domain [Trinorchestia longiramus]
MWGTAQSLLLPSLSFSLLFPSFPPSSLPLPPAPSSYSGYCTAEYTHAILYPGYLTPTHSWATAVILSAMCVLLLAVIGLTYFFQQLRQRRLDAKLAAHVPGHRVFTTDGGTATYQLQPAPIATLKPSQVIITPQQPQHVIYQSSVTAKPVPLTDKAQPMTSKQPFSVSATYPQVQNTHQDGGHGSRDSDNMAERMTAKSKIAASCSPVSHRPDRISTGSLPSYEEVQNTVLVPARSTCSRKGKLWYSLHYDQLQQVLLLHLQQASLPQARPPSPVWVEVCLLTLNNTVHTRTTSTPTTATQSPVFNTKLAFQVEKSHLDQLLLRLTLYSTAHDGGHHTALGSIILLLHSIDLTLPTPTIADFN